jgi:hypothetical protein
MPIFLCKLANFLHAIFCVQSSEALMFHPDYRYITDKLPVSLVKRTHQRLLRHSRNPILPEQITEKYDRIEDHLRHTLEVYQNLLNRKRKTMNCKNTSQPEVTYPAGIYEPPELTAFKRQLLEHNRDTFG